LREHPDLNVAFVTMASPGPASVFKAKLRSPHVFIADEARKLHAEFGVEIGGFSQMINPRTLVRGVVATGRHGFGQPVGDPLSLGGAFVIAPNGAVTWEQRAKDAAHNAEPDAIRKALLAAKEEA